MKPTLIYEKKKTPAEAKPAVIPVTQLNITPKAQHQVHRHVKFGEYYNYRCDYHIPRV